MMLCYRRKLSGLTVGLFVVDPGLWLVLLFFQRLAYRWTILGTEDKVINLSFSCSHSDIVSILFYFILSQVELYILLLCCPMISYPSSMRYEEYLLMDRYLAFRTLKFFWLWDTGPWCQLSTCLLGFLSSYWRLIVGVHMYLSANWLKQISLQLK